MGTSFLTLEKNKLSCFFPPLTGPPASVTLTNSPNRLNFVAGEGVTFSCSSTGGNPTPTLELLRSGVVVDSATDGLTTLTDTFPAWGEMDGAPIVCRAINSAGQEDTTKTITVDSKMNVGGVAFKNIDRSMFFSLLTVECAVMDTSYTSGK